jgi:RNA polymerase sigma-70 factor (ECF subfamily)
MDMSATPNSREGPRPSASEEDVAWVARIRAGDQAAFDALFRRYAGELADYVYRHTGDREEAEDVVQVLFTNLWLGRERWTLRGTLSGYLFLAARNILANRRRHTRTVERWRARVVGVARVVGQRMHPGPDDQYEAAEVAAAIDAAIREFPTQRRSVCRLRWVEGLAYSEIAARLGVTEKTVERHLGEGFKVLCARVPAVRGVR